MEEGSGETFDPCACSEQKPWKLEGDSRNVVIYHELRLPPRTRLILGKSGCHGDSFQVTKAVAFCKELPPTRSGRDSKDKTKRKQTVVLDFTRKQRQCGWSRRPSPS